jgi:hypothetical membrane protein
MSEPSGKSSSRGLLLISGLSGIIGIVLPMAMIMTAVQISHWFSWQTNVLSDLGVHDVAPIFNSALILGGILTFIFILGLRLLLIKKAINTIAVIIMLIGAVCLVLIGIFTLDEPLIHTIVAYGYFTLMPIGLILVGIGTQKTGLRWFSLIIGAFSLIAIYLLPMLLTMLSLGFGVPELIETTLLEVWVIILAVILLRSYRSNELGQV